LRNLNKTIVDINESIESIIGGRPSEKIKKMKGEKVIGKIKTLIKLFLTILR
jgi:hypothetical protein